MSYHENRRSAKADGAQRLESRVAGFARGSAIGLALRGRSARSNDEIIPVDHFRSAADAEDDGDVRRGASPDFLGIVGIVSDKATADLMGIGTAHHHGVTARKLSIHPDHAGRK
jgi:hypothetical protein